MQLGRLLTTFVTLSHVLGVGCGSAPEREGDSHPNVVLIVLDTVRSDHIGCYGYARPLTPNLDALAREATRFSRARATAPWTLPSHASMFTGLYPTEHGAHSIWIDYSARAPGLPSVDNVRPLRDEPETLAESLGDAGYISAAFVANQNLNPRTEIFRGFDEWHILPDEAGEVNRQAFAWLDGRAGDPFFLFLNFMEAHLPYDARPRPDLFETTVPHDSIKLSGELYGRVLGKREKPREEIRTLVDQYDRAIANLDVELGNLFEQLRARGMWEDLLLVVTSDHGEYFGEHDLIEHSKDVYEPAMAIPLIIKAPGQRSGEVREDWVSLAHIPHLVLEHVREARMDGARPLVSGDPVLAENHYTRPKDLRQPWGGRFRRVRHVLYDDDWKLIVSSDGQHELYRLSADPAETRNLFADDPSRAYAMMNELEHELELTSPATDDRPGLEISKDELERLEALGYH